jgi:magnesium chelatase accessory protein
MPTNHKLWDGIIQRLSGHFRCFAVDLPGMGETPFTPYGTDFLDRMAKRIETLRIQHGVRKWHVVGHDAGAAVAVQYAGSFSRRVGCLVLLSPALFPDLKPFFLLNPLRKPFLGELLAPLLHFVFWKVAMRRALSGKSGDSLLNAFYKPFSGLTGAWQLMRLVRWGRPEEMLGKIPAKLASLPMPTLLVHGSRDVLPAAFAERAAALIRHSSLVKLDSGHFIPLDRPSEVAASLSSFFAENGVTIPQPSQALKPPQQTARMRTAAAALPVLSGNRSLAAVS